MKFDNCQQYCIIIIIVPAEEFYYTSQGKSITIDGVNDQEDFITLQQSFQSLGFGSNQLLALYKLLAAILHLGNVTVRCRKGSIHEDASYIDSESKEIVLVSKLLGLSVTNLCKWLCNKKIVTKHDCLIKSFTMSQVEYNNYCIFIQYTGIPYNGHHWDQQTCPFNRGVLC